ncbi:DAK2 domain-containing protein [Alkalibacter mobilis]|uniref:DAK2 domain-containing protein n=1 Tax=Alkalibacter mobilis TaxID=2787712 RepID=UPI0018A06280|nr:DAK2 domain-containing protein [Alkalibacter mobilis]MBF7095848.1 DAK2 domain-containing protein [Alkalibacter mobilis]
MQTKFINGNLIKRMLMEASANLDANKTTVDDLNVFPVPDGDTGTNMSLTMRHAAKEIEAYADTSVSEITSVASSGALMGARGNSGVILSQLLRGLSKACKGLDEANMEQMAIALQSASDMAYKAVMKPTEGTILTVARGMAEFAMNNHSKYEYMEDFLMDIITEGRKVLDKTPEMLKVLKDAGVVDAGGMGLIFIMEGAHNALTGKESVYNEVIDWEKPVEDKILSPEDITFGYCTEFIIIGENDEQIRSDLAEEFEKIGDSIIVVGDEEKIKVHLHTDNPDIAMGKAMKIGSLTKIKIDNMREQVETKSQAKSEVQTDEPKKYGIIAVASGKGMQDLFMDMGVDEVILGGQTMNPSTEDFISRIDKINAENIIILPNNSNIILAANQSRAISKKNVIVIPTKTVPQGITALIGFNSESTVEDNDKNMSEAIKGVKTGQVTYAVRDTSFKGKEIKKDDIIGIFDGEIACIGNDPQKVCLDLFEIMIDEDSELVSIYYGENVSEENANDLLNNVEEDYEELDVELHWGGQPLYYYIVSVE